LSFIEELKRRNVFRVGIAYVIGSWLLLQLTDVLSQLLELPGVVGRVVVLLVAIGLPVTLLFAWAFEMTPEGVKREKDVDRSQSITPQTGKKLNNTIIVMLFMAVAYLLYDKFSAPAQPGSDHFSQPVAGQPKDSGEKSALTPVDAIAQANAEAEPVITKQSIAVLPFDNRSNRDEDEFFVEGMHDDLLTNLAKIGSLKVISRTSVIRYRNTEIPIPEIARELGVATIMEGAVQRAGDTVRINVQLIDAQTDEHLWAEIFDRELTTENLFAIQTEISKEIAQALKAEFSAEEQQRVNERPTDNLAAYSAYLRGRQLIARRTADTVDRALIEFQRAVQLDPQFALAWAGIAQSAQLALWVSDMDRPESIQLSQEAVEKALAINDQLGEVQLARATLILLKRGDQEEAEAALKLAIELSPGYAQAWLSYSEFTSDIPNRLNEALELAEKAAELDPLSPAIQNQVIDVLRRLGNYEEAQQRLSRLIEQDPDFAASYELMSDIKSQTGRFDEAIWWLHKAQSLDPGNIGLVLGELWPQLNIGNSEELGPLLARMEVMDPDSSTLSFMELWINFYNGDIEAALEAARLFDQRTGYRPGGKFPQAMVYMLQNNQTAFREITEEIIPAFYNRETFQAALDQRPNSGCLVAWSLVHTGDEEMGLELARQTIEYFRNHIPGSDEDFTTAICHMVLGQPEQELLVIENAVKSGIVKGWWQILKHPAYQLLQFEPRFVAAAAEIQSMLAIQRENLQRLNLEAQ
jgi:TolB-like protein/Tfp pilus assembly protein PilF